MKIFHKFVILFDEGFPADLSGDAPEKSLTLVAVSGRGGGPEDKVVGGRAGDRVDQSLQGLLEHVHFLNTNRSDCQTGRPELSTAEVRD